MNGPHAASVFFLSLVGGALLFSYVAGSITLIFVLAGALLFARCLFAVQWDQYKKRDIRNDDS